ncbi:ubiquinone biosynthesis protein COQ9 [Myriangium duriaei CBS 260.36]|uniref:Ubiquinone biosynthesis protein n=1 Tax=Myriangium duriaei CBS 260.36 TaxID=1168546 RepID=A0A9P4J5F7_9PEZI|nr:ubiquinone biosynthesis protein COQ9 [Myriangium duriaei CBS 260.36]
MASLRPLSRRLNLRPLQRAYHSPTDPPPQPYTSNESAILSSALSYVPTTGFTLTSLRSGLSDQGYRPVSTALFPRGPFELVRYHLITQRLSLRDRIVFPDTETSVGRKVRALILARLQGNVDAGVVEKWSEALGWMSLAGNIPASVEELALLSDEMWYLAGDTTVDAGWYTKRASLGAVYAAAELFQSQDQSTDFRDTEAFLDRRLEESRTIGGVVGNLSQWAGFQGVAAVNLARSLGMRI